MKVKNSVIAVLLSLVLLVSMGSGAVLANSHEEGAPSAETPAADLRSHADHILSEHGFGTIIAMQKVYSGSPDVEQVKEVVNTNNAEVQEAVASLFGEAAAEEFSQLWNAHVGYFMDYATATKNNDQAAKQTALDNLKESANLMGTMIEELTEGRLTAAAVTDMFLKHEQQVAGSFDAFVAGDYQTSYALQSEAMKYLINTMNATMAGAFEEQFPEKFEHTKALTAAANLRSEMNYMLGEHFVLAGQTMQKRFAGAPDAEAGLAALNLNTEKLTAAITSLYGEEAGSAFAELWSSHIDYYMQYTDATANENAEEKEAAVANLEQFRDQLSQLLSQATEGLLDEAAVAESAQKHIDTTLATLDSFAAGDYQQTWTVAHEGYVHMFDKSKMLSAAFVKQFPDKFAGVGMPQTGMGGMANTNSMTWMLWIVPLLLLAGAAVFTRRKSLQ